MPLCSAFLFLYVNFSGEITSTMKKRKSTLLLLVFFAFCFMESAAFELSNHSEISILTCSPGNKPYSVYGHSAIRVRDSIFRYDVVFNYGIFDFNSSNFVMRFAKGQTNYLLGTTRFETFFKGYVIERRGVLEQRLNLTLIEKQKIFDFLLWNADPENRVYRYNFFFDNCENLLHKQMSHIPDAFLPFVLLFS